MFPTLALPWWQIGVLRSIILCNVLNPVPLPLPPPPVSAQPLPVYYADHEDTGGNEREGSGGSTKDYGSRFITGKKRDIC